ncbi:putative baseplate assembly protein [Aerosakkonema sp. BLCC-F183]|uniref:putative baseplate assembly protein n=1 Tax=Aerosakkonema sp. BLCC-F183 TaxID=3342834 RepID=UPI0035B7D57F
MSIKRPKIDNRTYEDIVKQTVKLAQRFTTDTCTALVERTSENLQDRILAEDIIEIKIIFSNNFPHLHPLIHKKLHQALLIILSKYIEFNFKDNEAEGIIGIGKGIIAIDSKGNIIIAKVEIIAEADNLVSQELAERISAKHVANLVKVRKGEPPQERESIVPIPGLLIKHTLDENIIDIDGQIIAKAGESVNQELAQKIAKLKTQLVKVKGWQARQDAGMALIRIFGRMAALVSDRLNQVPDKNFLAFLDLIGTQLSPPQPAKVPLTFSLVEGSPEDALVPVPAHTQVAVSPVEGQEEEVVFETDRELVVTTAQLKEVFVWEPEKDKYSDRTKEATGKEDAAFFAFKAEEPIEHSLYLACDPLFSLPEPKTVTLTIQSPEADKLSKLLITWSYWDGAIWRSLSPTLTHNNDSLKVKIDNLSTPIQQQQINGVEAAWLRANPLILTEDADKGAKELKVNNNNIKNFEKNDSIQLISDKQSRENYKVLSVDYDKKAIAIEPKLQSRYPKGTYVWLAQLPSITGNTVRAKIENIKKASNRCFFNTAPIDLSKDFYPFGEQPRFNDTFYIALDEVFIKLTTDVEVEVKLSPALSVKVNPSDDLEINWEFWDGNNWESLKDITCKFTKDENITINFAAKKIAATTVGGENGYWVRARIVNGNYGTENATQVTSFSLLTETAKVQTDSAQKQTIKVKSVRGFINENLWIGLGSDREEATITNIDFSTNTITLKTALTKDYSAGTIVSLRSTSVFGPPSVQSLTLSYTYNSEDTPLSACQTYNDVTYLDPFASDRYLILTTSANSGQTQLTLNSIAGLKSGDRFVIDPDGQEKEQNEIVKIDSATKTVRLKIALKKNYQTETKIFRFFQPFTLAVERDPTLYLGFNQPFPNRAIALYFQVEPPKPEEVTSTANLSDAEPVRLVWEYSNRSGWNRLGVVDETKAFTERGLIRCIGPSDFQARSEFGKSLYWLRVRKESGEFRVQPRLRRILTNTIWAIQATTLNNEVLGSSDGNPNQTFWTTQTPVLQGQQLEVQEGKEPPPEEKAAIANLEGKDAIAIVQDEVGQIEAVWVRWHEVTDFYESGMRDRHYVMNHLTGEIQFGDGQRGMIPPQGRNNIRMAQYRTDGGERGNKPANTITQLKTTIPYIDSVINLEAAGGGSDRESIERVKERGAKFLRHRNRAVTAQDFEDLAYEASPDIARTRVITSIFHPRKIEEWIDQASPDKKLIQEKQEFARKRQINVLIVPNSNESQPVLSLALIDRVQTYIKSRCLPTVDLKVSGPDWIQISVTAELVPESLEAITHIQEKAIAKLEQFLHPLTGNRNQQGWDFGCEPDFSDFYALLQSIEGVNYVRNLLIKKSKQTSDEEKNLGVSMIYSGKHLIEISQIN